MALMLDDVCRFTISSATLFTVAEVLSTGMIVSSSSRPISGCPGQSIRSPKWMQKVWQHRIARIYDVFCFDHTVSAIPADSCRAVGIWFDRLLYHIQETDYFFIAGSVLHMAVPCGGKAISSMDNDRLTIHAAFSDQSVHRHGM